MPKRYHAGGGVMGGAVRDYNWQKHHLGAMNKWPESLRSSLGICLHSTFPSAILWGNEYTVFYNDSFIPLIGSKHPGALGASAPDVWNDIWPILQESVDETIRHGEGTTADEVMLPMYRRGYIEEAYFNYSVSPIYGVHDNIDGVLLVASEVTNRVLSRRRSANLHAMYQETIHAESAEAACIIASNHLLDAPYDIPFSQIYLLSSDETKLRLVADSSLDAAQETETTVIDLIDDKRILPFKEVIEARKMQVVHNFNRDLITSPGIWQEPPRHLAMLPIVKPGGEDVYGVVVAAISPRLFFDASYAEYFNDVAGSIAYSINNAIDTKKNAVLEAMEKRAQHKLRAALSSGLMGIWEWDIAKNLIYGDRDAARLLCVDPVEAELGVNMAELESNIHADDVARMVTNFEKSARGNRWEEIECRVPLQNGDVRWLLVRGSIELNNYDKAVRLYGVVVDISKQKRIESDLADSQAVFQSLYNSNILGMAVASLDGTIHEANSAFLRMLGYTKNDLHSGLTSQMLTPKSSVATTKNIYAELAEKGEATVTNKVYLRKDGSTMPGLVGAVRTDGDDRFVSFILDLSEEAHLRELNLAKDEFISIASHQLRTPASGVKQNLGMILEGYAGNVTQRQKQLIQIAYTSNERQLAIINDLLRIAEADAKEVSLAREKTNLKQLVKDVSNELSAKLLAKQQTLRFDFCKQPAPGYIDPFYIRMAIENLLDNAQKYTPEHKTITIRIRALKNVTQIAIIDEGIGIKKVNLPKLFKKFSRIPSENQLGPDGSGLGLYWVKKIIDMHGGKIDVDSQWRKGTAFTVSLPNRVDYTVEGIGHEDA
jgi:PAS domain S-box-containing protein